MFMHGGENTYLLFRENKNRYRNAYKMIIQMKYCDKNPLTPKYINKLVRACHRLVQNLFWRSNNNNSNNVYNFNSFSKHIFIK